MSDAGKVKMKIKVADETIPLTVQFDEQNDVRDTEVKINLLYAQWHQKFPHKTTKELLAMMTYQYASYYMAYARRHSSVVDMLKDFESKIDDIINSVD